MTEVRVSQTPEFFAVMTKPVGPRCNLACSYCYYLETERFANGPRALRMTDTLLETFVRQYIEASPGPVVPFTWHGGEPTLAGIDFYKKAVALQQKYLPEGWTCWNNLQTNGVLLDDAWCAFLAEAQFDVGLSIDGTQAVHDTFRRDHTGSGSYDKAAAAVRRLQDHGIQPDLLCTVTSATAKNPLAVYGALRDLNTGWIQFIPIVRRTGEGETSPQAVTMPQAVTTSESVTADGYGDFLCKIFDTWLVNDLGRVEVQLFAETARVLSGGEAGLCWMAPTCGRVLVVEQDGGVYACDHFVAPEFRLGSLENDHLGALVDLPVQRRFGNNKKAGLPAACRACPWLRLCNGGCPKDRFGMTEDGEPGLNVLCGGLRQFFAHTEAPLKQLAELRRQCLGPKAIMARFRAERAALWKNVGRNDPCPCGSGRKAKVCCWSERP